ncbi:MAG: type II secretion system F family protein [Patescibacteria group bacterium]
MTTYSYSAKTPEGGTNEKGEIEAESTNEAASKLREKGLLPITIGLPKKKLDIRLFKKKVPLREKIIFTRQLAVMVKAGLPLTSAIQALRKQTENSKFQEVLDDVIIQVRGGQTLSSIMGKHTDVFPDVYIAVVRAGESTGKLSEVLFTLAQQQEKQAELISKVKGALMYPAVILVALIGVIGLIVFFVLPSLQTIFADFGSELPFTTKLLFSTSTFAQRYYWLIALILIALFYLLRFSISKPRGRLVFDRFVLIMPVFGDLTKKVYMANFARTMAMLTQASLPILESIKIVRRTISNKHYDNAFVRISQAVENGQPLSKAIGREPIFPPMVTQLINLGEQSGELESVLGEISRFYDSEVDNITRNLSALIEPIMLIIMGVGVAFVVTSVLSPIYKLVENF